MVNGPEGAEDMVNITVSGERSANVPAWSHFGFLEQMQNRRTTLARQLGQAEYEHIRPMISGELKAIDQVIDEYIHLFELQDEHESPNKDLESE